MERYTLQELTEIIKIPYKNGRNLAEVRETRIRTFLSRREAPCQTAIKKLVEKLEIFGLVSDAKKKNRLRRSRTAENIAAVGNIAAVACSITVIELRYGEMINDIL